MESDYINYLIVSGKKEFSEIIRFIVECRFKSNVSVSQNPSDAMEYLKKANSFPQLIIYDYDPDCFLVEDFIMYLRQNAHSTHIAILVDNVSKTTESVFQNLDNVHPITRENCLPELQKLSLNLFCKKEILNGEPYCRIHLDAVDILDGVRNYLYISLNSGKFIKLFNEDDVVDELDIKKYREKRVDFLYLERKSCDWIIKQLNKQFHIFLKSRNFKFIVRSPDEPPQKKFEQKLIRVTDELHIDPEFKEEIVGMTDKIYGAVAKSPSLAQIFAYLKKNANRFSYINQRTQFMSLVTCALAKSLEWHSKATLNKLIYASILHDITLVTREHLLILRDLKDFQGKEEGLTAQDKEIYLNHSKEAASLVKQAFSVAPAETNVIILQHHEQPDGKGFPGRLSGDRISPLSALFIICNDFASYYLFEDEPELSDFCLKAEKKYDTGPFKRVMRVFENLKL